MTRVHSIAIHSPWPVLRRRSERRESETGGKRDEAERGAALARAEARARVVRDATCAAFFMEHGRLL